MTLAELVADTRTDREVYEEWAELLKSIMDLEDRLDSVEAEINRRGYTI